MQDLTASVGRGGLNLRPDVLLVQGLLKAKGFDPGQPDGRCGPLTIKAIHRFQASFLPVPDGLIEPGKNSWQRLIGAAKGLPTPAPAPLPKEWEGDPARWPAEKKMSSMKPELAVKVRQVLAALTAKGFQPKVFYGWRSVTVQAKLFAEGKSKVKFSFHNAQLPDGTPNAYAADIIDARYAWTAEAESSGFWKALGVAAKAQGLVWGGDWVSFRDWAHVQLVANSELAKVKKESGL